MNVWFWPTSELNDIVTCILTRAKFYGDNNIRWVIYKMPKFMNSEGRKTPAR